MFAVLTIGKKLLNDCSSCLTGNSIGSRGCEDTSFHESQESKERLRPAG